MSRNLKRNIMKLGNSKEGKVLEKMKDWHNLVSLGELVTLLEVNMVDRFFCRALVDEPRKTIAWLLGATDFPIVKAVPLTEETEE